MTTIKELCQPPDREVKVDIFIHSVKDTGERLQKTAAYQDLFSLHTRKYLTETMDGFVKLGKIFGDDLNLELGELSPLALSDDLDRQTASCCIAEVHAQCTSKSPLEVFVDEITKSAKELGGSIDEDDMQLLSTAKDKDLITLLGNDPFPMFASHLLFIFK